MPAFGALALLAVSLAPQEPPAVDHVVLTGVTFASEKGQMFVRVRPLGAAMDLTVEYDPETEVVTVGDRVVQDSEWRTLFDGSRVVALRVFQDAGAEVHYDYPHRTAEVLRGGLKAFVREGEKRVEVSIKRQELRAWQGEELVMVTPISSGKRGHTTPTGHFKAGPAKARMHYSRLYNNSPMPWSVQINGNIFIHGYKSVPRYPASHGCIRMPLKGRNAAQWFWHWVDLGTPVSVLHDFSEPVSE
jgi:hypothetical protein